VNLVLVGYRGSGKSTIGAILAKQLGWSFIDVDILIAQHSGRTIAELFAEEGESGFRKRERDACQSLRRSKRTVIALGGGALNEPENRTLVRRLGKVVWLRAPAAILWARISQDAKSADDRPDLTSTGGLPEVEAMLEEREPLYRRVAHHMVDTFPGAPDDIAAAIEIWYQANDAPRSE